MNEIKDIRYFMISKYIFFTDVLREFLNSRDPNKKNIPLDYVKENVIEFRRNHNNGVKGICYGNNDNPFRFANLVTGEFKYVDIEKVSHLLNQDSKSGFLATFNSDGKMEIDDRDKVLTGVTTLSEYLNSDYLYHGGILEDEVD